jgi:membrane fusion protein, multidrug efflux system
LKNALLVSGCLVVMAACGTQETPRAKAPEAKPAGESVAAATVEWPGEYEATGTVRARTATAIASKAMGYVQQVHAAVGDRVAEGQTLVTIDARELDVNVRRADAGRATAESGVPEVEQAIAGAKANLDLAQSTFRRMEDLAAKKSISAQEFDEASARLKAAQAAYDMALSRRAQLQAKIAQAEEERKAARIAREYAEVKAPFAGVVTEKTVEPGTLASPGVPLMTLEREGGYRLEAAVEESRIAGVRAGQTVRVALEGCNQDARVSEIVPAVDAASRSYTVKIDLAPAKGCANLRTGMFGRAIFPVAARTVLAIPANAIVEQGQLQSVMVVENGTAHSRLITAGLRRGDSVEVISGLQAGERVEVKP